MTHFSETIIGDKKAQFRRGLFPREKMAQMSAEQFLQAYRDGRFVIEQDDIFYSCSGPWREIIPLDKVPSIEELPHDIKKLVKKARFLTSVNQAFPVVARECSRPDWNPADRWIGEKTLRLLTELHHLGHAHSLEVWADGRLAAGAVGLQIGASYIGMSSFHAPESKGAGNAASFALHTRLHQADFTFFDSISPSTISQLLGGRLVRSTDIWPLRQEAMKKAISFPTGFVWLEPALFAQRPSASEQNQVGFSSELAKSPKLA